MNQQVFVREYIFQGLMCNTFSSLSVAPERVWQVLGESSEELQYLALQFEGLVMG